MTTLKPLSHLEATFVRDWRDDAAGKKIDSFGKRLLELAEERRKVDPAFNTVVENLLKRMDEL